MLSPASSYGFERDIVCADGSTVNNQVTSHIYENLGQGGRWVLDSRWSTSQRYFADATLLSYHSILPVNSRCQSLPISTTNLRADLASRWGPDDFAVQETFSNVSSLRWSVACLLLGNFPCESGKLEAHTPSHDIHRLIYNACAWPSSSGLNISRW